MKKFMNMTEFAAQLGLSRGTVSNILNKRWKERNISPKTAEKVLAYAKETKFTPNIFGRGIQGKLDTDVAILMPVNAFEHHKQAFFKMLNILENTGKRYYVFPLHCSKENDDIVARLVQYKVKKAIVIAAPVIHKAEEAEWWKEVAKDTPQVQWCFYDFQLSLLPLAHFPANACITGFNRLEAYKMVLQHVVRKGYKNLVISSFQTSKEMISYTESLPIAVFNELNSKWEKDLYSAGRQIGEFLLHSRYPRKETAVFIPDDTVAIGAVNYLQEHDIRIPADYGVISWDGLEISKYSAVPLTTLEITADKMMETVSRFIANKRCRPVEEVTPHIREGASL